MNRNHTIHSRFDSHPGSALILTVVLTSLLAIVGVLFVMVSRIDQMTSAASVESKDLDLAVHTLVSQIERELVEDVPGVAGQEYEDYPGPNDVWLAAMEPNDSQMWQQISDVTGALSARGWSINDIAIDDSAVGAFNPVIPESRPLLLASDGTLIEQLADADGDGVADAKWFRIPGITTGKGRPIYAAVRIIDNAGMLNVNTGFGFNPFDPNVPASRASGSSVLHINTLALAGPRNAPPSAADANDLLFARANYGYGLDPNNLAAYEQNVIWNYSLPVGYTPFDISDELELRYRYLLNHSAIDARIEAWGNEFRSGAIWTPVEQGGRELDNWFKRASDDGSLDPNYAFRHLATVYSMDRVINPDGGKMVNINRADKVTIQAAVMQALLDADPNLPDAVDRAAQIAANIVDYRDNDSTVTYYDANSTSYNGFERPCVYISEVAANVVTDGSGNTFRSYAVELFKPYGEDANPPTGQWELVIDGSPIPIRWSGTRRFHVMRAEEAQAPLSVAFNDPAYPGNGTPQTIAGYSFAGGSSIYLQRRVRGVGVVVDTFAVPSAGTSGWLEPNAGPRSIERDITMHKCIRKLWAGVARAGVPTLGSVNAYVDADTGLVQAHPTNEPFTNIGEIGMVLAGSGYNVSAGATASDLLIDLRNPLYSRLLNYLTVIDPTDHGQPAEETRVKGRININTAPWYVLEQLPWMSVNPIIGRTVQAVRDDQFWGFRGTPEMTQIPQMAYYADPANPMTQGDQTGLPDLTYLQRLENAGVRRDLAPDDMEERDLIFQRISNLVTVRSDIFTAYMLLRIGPDGPQRRMVAILDRSQVDSADDRVRILALHPVADPR